MRGAGTGGILAAARPGWDGSRYHLLLLHHHPIHLSQWRPLPPPPQEEEAEEEARRSPLAIFRRSFFGQRSDSRLRSSAGQPPPPSSPTTHHPCDGGRVHLRRPASREHLLAHGYKKKKKKKLSRINKQTDRLVGWEKTEEKSLLAILAFHLFKSPLPSRSGRHA